MDRGSPLHGPEIPGQSPACGQSGEGRRVVAGGILVFGGVGGLGRQAVDDTGVLEVGFFGGGLAEDGAHQRGNPRLG